MAVIIVAYKARDLIRKCLESLRSDGYPSKRIIVVDNCSDDGTVEMISAEFPEAHLIRNDVNRGFAAACNQGLRLATEPVAVLLNQDTEVDSGWLRWLVRGLSADPLAGIAGCKIFYPDGRTIQHAGGTMKPNALTNHIGEGEQDGGAYDRIREVEYVTGAAMAIRTELLQRIGLLDEDYRPAYFEELDLCFRARKRGYHVLYIPEATLRHHESTSTGKMSARFFELYHRNRIRFILKNYSLPAFFGRFLPFEFGWLSRHCPPEQKIPLRKAYLTNLKMLPRSLISRFRRSRHR